MPSGTTWTKRSSFGLSLGIQEGRNPSGDAQMEVSAYLDTWHAFPMSYGQLDRIVIGLRLMNASA